MSTAADDDYTTASESDSAPLKRRRRESPHASIRKAVTLAQLMRARALRTGDVLTFRYRTCVYYARMASDACICSPRPLARRRTHDTASSSSHYNNPTAWALDCMDAYWSAHGTEPRQRTNPSGYERVRCVRTGASLQSMRNDFMQAPPPPPPRIATGALEACIGRAILSDSGV